jgi:DNA-binding NarL/FixJ family response regulator
VRQIAAQLHLSRKTVETYRGRIQEKLNIRGGFELTRHAILWNARFDDQGLARKPQ